MKNGKWNYQVCRYGRECRSFNIVRAAFLFSLFVLYSTEKFRNVHVPQYLFNQYQLWRCIHVHT